MTTPHLRNSISRSPLRRGLILIALALACFALSPRAQAVTPAPDGGYPGGNTAEGDGALFSLTTGTLNTAIGADALYNNTTGNFNTANGAEALLSNTTGGGNTATGAEALVSNTTGFDNSATGAFALQNNTTGYGNTANGADALVSNATGFDNTATGAFALQSNTTGNANTANGNFALGSNITGFNNTANGESALYSNTTGHSNTANGVFALIINTTGEDNTATGFSALYSNTTGRNNTADGQNAMRNNTSGSFNVALGDHAGFNLTTGSNNIEIGNRGVAGEASTIRIGKQGTQTVTYIAGISGATVPTGVAVIIDSSGHLGTTTCSARFKEAIQPMDKASEAILALKPVTFRYKRELDPDGIPQFGLIAEQVEKVNPNLVVRDEDGKVNTVRYEAVNAMLLNEFLKEHRKVQKLEAALAQQEKKIEALAAGSQKVSARLETSETAGQIVVSNQ